MNIGTVLDYIDEFLEIENPKKISTRKATQTDMDNF
jgi:hypothetical protein